MKSAHSLRNLGDTKSLCWEDMDTRNVTPLVKYLIMFCSCNAALLLCPWDRLRSTVMSMSVCVSVCPQGYLRNHTPNLYQIFCACCLCPWLSPHPACWLGLDRYRYRVSANTRQYRWVSVSANTYSSIGADTSSPVIHLPVSTLFHARL